MPGELNLRALQPADRDVLATILRATAVFYEQDLVIALELIDEGLAPRPDATPADPHAYRFVVAELLRPDRSTAVSGYACYGLAPLSDGVYDLYWIAVDPALHGRGIGKALLRAAEADAAGLRGRMLLIETGGKPSYAPTRAFYERSGYREIARLPDYYRLGDDKVVYGRKLEPGGKGGSA